MTIISRTDPTYIILIIFSKKTLLINLFDKKM